MYTLPAVYRTPEFFEPVLYKLSEMVALRLRKKSLAGRVLSVYVRTTSDMWLGKTARLGIRLWSGPEIFEHSRRILATAGMTTQQGVKLVGVTIAELEPALGQQDLFGFSARQARLNRALDRINLKYGGFMVCRVPVLKAKEIFRDSVGFGRIKEIGLV